MATRVFLGWDRPFAERAVEWLLEQRATLADALVVVPTAASGRRLREALAASAGGLLSPLVTTPGELIKAVDEEPDTAPEWMETVAWVDVLESVTDWQPHAAVFPEPPGEGADWAGELAGEMLQLRGSLQENGLTLAQAARRFSDPAEAARWRVLAAFEARVEARLASWGYASRSRKLASGLPPAALPPTVILAGITELAPLVAALLAQYQGNLTALIAAPPAEAEFFCPLGLPLMDWSTRVLPWPEAPWGSVRVVADPRQQAAEAVACLAEAATPADEVALGSADDEAGAALLRALDRHGWNAFHPAAPVPQGGLRTWLHAWRRWLESPTLAAMGDLLTLPQCTALTGGDRPALALRLAELRGAWMCQDVDDLARRLGAARFRDDTARTTAEAVLAVARALENWSTRFVRESFATAMTDFLTETGGPGDSDMRAWLAAAAPVMARLPRRAGFWLDLMLASVPAPAAAPPPDRVIDIHGWLEMLHAPGRHLVLCGVNDGRVPTRSSGDPWLAEGARELLGLPGEAQRAARDAFLYHSLLESRRNGGRVDLICGKTGSGGEPLQPSRLLLAAPRSAMPQRVTALFRDVPPSATGLRWEPDWDWTPPHMDPPARISVTALKDYLTCPFRYYLKQLAGLTDPETARGEWNQRDFGTVAHTVLERWGDDPEAREYSKTEAIADWLHHELDRVVAAWFGRRVPLAVRIQAESLRQRLTWFARGEAVRRAEGWRVVDVERKVELSFGDATVVAKIDRIDRHEDSGIHRVLDYKTGSITRGVAGEHCVKVTAATVLPAHPPPECGAIFHMTVRNAPVEYRWTNLQLPLYALALSQRGMGTVVPAYLTLGSTEERVGLEEWTDFSAAEMAAAETCAAGLVRQIRSGVFWPPVERVSYDDYRDLGAGRSLCDAFKQPE